MEGMVSHHDNKDSSEGGGRGKTGGGKTWSEEWACEQQEWEEGGLGRK